MSALERLEASVAALDSVAVGLSGGVDSSLLVAVAHRVLGDRAVAVVARSPSLPARELDGAIATAEAIGIDLEVVTTSEVDDPRYAANPTNRCLFCKDHQFAALQQVADRRGLATIAHGETADDIGEHRPGRAAAERWGARAPLREAGLGKDAIRDLARQLGLPVWDKPAFACLSSRIPYGDEVTPQKLARIDAAEQRLFDMGFSAFRVRHHDDLARLELDPVEHGRAVREAATIVAALREVGYAHVTLDLAGLDASRTRPGRGATVTDRLLPVVEVTS
ncbi:ATP-dependent sacrificial sulfur transferase LarE [Nitriliruptor alkaliphilus]|uniref:ATP-dependent sacrificial sulfur transferase LarE n=1 Tax=Nitriliruptor alkaliphilus TaxID=427918 RepID=UPI0006961AB4|nr:ATP-dependent sacrificial sulfur transferase LarE [Nitriliruptor alkaliphilus]